MCSWPGLGYGVANQALEGEEDGDKVVGGGRREAAAWEWEFEAKIIVK